MEIPFYHLTNLSKGSHQKVKFICPNCKQTTIRQYRSCVNKNQCSLCASLKRKKNNIVIPFEQALKTLSKGSHQKVRWECPECKKHFVKTFKSAIKTNLCKKCNNQKTRPIMKGKDNPFYGKKHNKEIQQKRVTKLLDNQVKKKGYDNYANFSKEFLTFLEEEGIGPNSVESKLKYPEFGKEVLRQLVHREGRADLIQETKASSAEKHLCAFIKEYFSGEVIANSRSVIGPKELDIYIPELQIAIEYNGLYWHTEDRVGKNYHFDKYQKCKEKGIALYNIWEHVYTKNPEAVKQFIQNLTSPKNSIYARKCQLITDKKRLRDFIKKWHLQGASNSHTYLGLEYEGEVVMALSLGSHHRGGSETVLNRVCYSRYHVVGGLEKLLSKCPRPLITWSDNCYSPNGNLYKKTGFEKVSELPPDYFYTSGDGTFFSKQSQRKALTNCPKNLTEGEWSKIRGLDKIWDCGKVKWILK